MGKFFSFSTGAIDAIDRHKRGLARILVLADSLAGFFRRAGDIEQIVGDLKHHAHVVGVGTHAGAMFVTGLTQDGAGFTGKFKKLAGFQTLQQEDVHNDVMPDLRELPDRKGRIQAGVSSDQLVGRTVDWFGKPFVIVDKGKTDWKATPPRVTVKDWTAMQLPPQGKPGHTDDERMQTRAYDATVLDWTWQGVRAIRSGGRL